METTGTKYEGEAGKLLTSEKNKEIKEIYEKKMKRQSHKKQVFTRELEYTFTL